MTVRKNTALQRRRDQADDEVVAQQKAATLAALNEVPVSDAWGTAFIELLEKGVAEGHRALNVAEIQEYLGRPTIDVTQPIK